MIYNVGVVKEVTQGTMICKETALFYRRRPKNWESANGMENKKNGSVVKKIKKLSGPLAERAK